jgi:alpha-galactosidase
MPYYGTGVNSVEPYLFRSQMTPGIALGLDAGNYPDGYTKLKRRLAEWREAAANYYGDYYPLTPYSLDPGVWMAWQFDAPEQGTGFVQAFRRPESPYETARFRLRGLDAEAAYLVRDVDAAADTVRGGAELMEQGLAVTLPERPAAALLLYRRQ